MAEIVLKVVYDDNGAEESLQHIEEIAKRLNSMRINVDLSALRELSQIQTTIQQNQTNIEHAVERTAQAHSRAAETARQEAQSVREVQQATQGAAQSVNQQNAALNQQIALYQQLVAIARQAYNIGSGGGYGGGGGGNSGGGAGFGGYIGDGNYLQTVNQQTQALQQYSGAAHQATQQTHGVIDAQDVWGNNNQQIVRGLDEVTVHAQRAGDTFLSAFKKMTFWATAGAIIFAPVRALKQALKELQAVDDELVTIRKVTGLAGEELDKLTGKAFKTASAYGIAASEYLNAVTAFSRAGYMEMSEPLAELSAKTQIVGDTTSETANQFLLSVDAAYKYKGSVEELTKVLDGANEIDNKYQTSLEKITSGLGVVSSVASSAGVGIDELTAAIGTITAVTQRSGTEAARAARALFLNVLGDTTTEIEEGVTVTKEQIKSLSDALQKYAPEAVAAAEATNSIVNPMEAIGSLAKAAKEGLITQADLMALVSDIGGKLRSDQLLALINNWDMYQSMLKDFGTAIGSADKEVANAMDSWTRKTSILKNTWVEFVQSIIDGDDIKVFLDFAIDLVSSLDDGAAEAIAFVAAFALVQGIITSTNAALQRMVFTQAEATIASQANNAVNLVNLSTLGLLTEQEVAAAVAAGIMTEAQGAAALATQRLTADQVLAAASAGELTVAQISAAYSRGILTEADIIALVALGRLTPAQAAHITTTYSAATAWSALTASMLANPLFWVGGIAAVIGIASFAMSKYKDSIEETADASRKQAESESKVAENTLELYAAYKNAETGTDELKKATDKLRDSFSDESEEIRGLITDLDELTQKRLENAKAANYAAKEDAGKELQTAYSFPGIFKNADVNLGGTSTAPTEIAKIFAGASKTISDELGTTYSAVSNNAEDVYKWYQALIKARDELNKQADELQDNSIREGDLYKEIAASIEVLSESAEKYGGALESYMKSEAILKVGNDLKTVSVTTQQEFDKYTDAIRGSKEYTDDYKAVLLSVANDAFPQFSKASDSASSANEKLLVSAKKLSDAISNIEDKVRSFHAAQKDMAESGRLSISTVKDLIDSGLEEYLVEVSDGYRLANVSLDDFKDAQIRAASGANDVLTAEAKKAAGIDDATMSIYEQLEALEKWYRVQAKAKWTETYSAMRDAGKTGSREMNAAADEAASDLYNLADSVQNVTKNYGLLERVAGSVGTELEKSGKKAKTAAEEAEEAWSKAAAVIEYALKQRKRAADASTDAIDAEIDGLEDLQDAQEKLADAEIDRLEDELDRIQGALKDEEDRLKAARDQSVDAKQAEIDALKEARDIEQDQLALEEKRLAVEKARKDLLDAQNERTVRYYNAAKDQWEWQADARNVAQAKEAMADAETELEEYIKELAYKDRIKELEAERDRIKAFYDAELDAIEAREKALEKQYEADIDAAKKRKEASTAHYDALIKQQELQRDAVQAQYDALAAQWDAIQNSINRPAEDITALLQQLSRSNLPQFAGIIDQVSALLAGLGGISYTPGTIGGSSVISWGGGSSYPGTLIKQGQTNDYVKQIQAALGVRQTGYFGTETLAAVRGFQGSNGLSVDGIVGPDTWRKLFPVFDQGGIARGKGIIIKDTAEDELVLSPEVTRALLKPQSNAQYSRNLASSGIMAGGAQVFNQASNAITTNNSTISNSRDTHYHVHGLSVNEPNPQWLTLEKLAQDLGVLSLYT